MAADNDGRRYLFPKKQTRVAMTRAYAHITSDYVRKDHAEAHGYEEMHFYSVVEHPSLGRCLQGMFMTGPGMFDVHFPIDAVRACTAEECEKIAQTVYRWSSGLVDRYPPETFISAGDLKLIIEQGIPPIAFAGTDENPTQAEAHLRPTKRAVHEAVRNIMFNELGLTKESLRHHLATHFDEIVRLELHRATETSHFEKLLVNAIASEVYGERVTNRDRTRQTEFADRMKRLITDAVYELIGKHLRVEVMARIDPDALDKLAERTRAISLPSDLDSPHLR